MIQLRSKTNSSLWSSSLAVNGIQKYSGAPFPCVGLCPQGNPLCTGLHTASTVDPRAFGQPDCWASAQVPGFHFCPLLGQEPRLKLGQLAEALTLFLSFCQLSLFLVFLPWSIYRSLGQDSGQQDARKSCLPLPSDQALQIDVGPNCTCIPYNWTWIHTQTLNLNCKHLQPGWVPLPCASHLSKTLSHNKCPHTHHFS